MFAMLEDSTGPSIPLRMFPLYGELPDGLIRQPGSHTSFMSIKGCGSETSWITPFGTLTKFDTSVSRSRMIHTITPECLQKFREEREKRGRVR